MISQTEENSPKLSQQLHMLNAKKLYVTQEIHFRILRVRFSKFMITEWLHEKHMRDMDYGFFQPLLALWVGTQVRKEFRFNNVRILGQTNISQETSKGFGSKHNDKFKLDEKEKNKMIWGGNTEY